MGLDHDETPNICYWHGLPYIDGRCELCAQVEADREAQTASDAPFEVTEQESAHKPGCAALDYDWLNCDCGAFDELYLSGDES